MSPARRSRVLEGSRALPPAVVIAAARRSPSPSGRGHHESGVPPGRRWAGGGGRRAIPGHPELPPKSRQDPGKPERRGTGRAGVAERPRGRYEWPVRD